MPHKSAAATGKTATAKNYTTEKLYYRKVELIMKLITAIVNKEDSRAVCHDLLKQKFYVTRLSTTGGSLKL